MPPNSTTYKARIPWKDACSVIPEEKLEELAKTGVDKWRKQGVPSHVMIFPMVEFWNAHHRVKVSIIIEEREKGQPISRAG
jgi:hypothetical protein